MPKRGALLLVLSTDGLVTQQRDGDSRCEPSMEMVGVSAPAEIDQAFQDQLPLLFSRCKAGDAAALDRLIAHTQPKMFGIAFAVTRSRDDALDITQETFVRFLDRLEEIREPAAVIGWLCRATVNLAIDALRRRRVRVAGRLPEGDCLPAAPPEDPGRSTEETRELGAIILGLAEQLSPQQKMAFLLRDVRGLTLVEVAESLECSVGATKAHLSLARAKLRTWLKARHPEYLE